MEPTVSVFVCVREFVSIHVKSLENAMYADLTEK